MVKIHPESSKFMLKLRTEKLVKLRDKRCIVLPQEELKLRTPIMIHRHLGVKANHVAAWTDASSGIGERRKILRQ